MSEGAPPSSAPDRATTRVVTAGPSAYSAEQLMRVKADLLENEVPESIGGYRIRSLLGSGGMGTVYEAEQPHPHRVVALKVIHSWAVSPSALRRFEVEAEALARLEHPYVARIYAVGTDDSGAPYLAMERVKGGSLATIAERKLKVRERLDLLARICDGVHYAHQRGVIHRDLKPSNIMVDDEGRPRILDFGVARLTDSDVRATTTSSKEVLVGTLPYMSPEQLGAGGDPDVRSDVYALGVIGYELLTGQLPMAVQDKPIGEAARIIRETEPKCPSTFDKTLSGDVDAILMKALAKDPAQRYPSAAAMADDIRRSLSYEPVTARRLTSSYQLGRFILRNPLLTALVAAVFLALTAGFAGTAYGLMKSHRLRQEVEGHLNDANIATGLANQQARHAELELAKGLVAQGGALDLAGMHADARARFIEAADRLRKIGTSSDPADVAWLASCELSPPPLVSLSLGRGAPVAVSFDAASKAWWVDSSAARQIDLRTGLALKTYNVKPAVAVFSMSRGTAYLAGASGLIAMDLKTGSSTELASAGQPITCLACSEDGRLLLTGDEQGALWLFDLETRKRLRRFQGRHRKAAVLALSPDGTKALSGGLSDPDATERGTLKLWDAASGGLVRTWVAHEKEITGVAFLPGGGAISAGLDQTLKRWDLRSDQPAVFSGQTGRITCLALSNDGRRVLTGGGDQAVVLWDVATAKAVRRFEGHHGIVTNVAFSADQQFALSAAGDGTLNVWDLSNHDAGQGVEEPITSERAAISRDARFVAARVGSQLRVIDCATGQVLSSVEAGQQAGCVAIAPNGTRFALGDDDGLLRIWRVGSTAPAVSLKAARKVSAVEFVGSDQLLVGRDDGKISVHDAATGQELRTLSDEQLGVTSLAVSNDGRMLLSGSFDHVVRLWDLAQSRVIFRLEGHLKSVNCVAFSPDGKRALSGSADQTLRLWDLDSGQLVHTFWGHGTSVVACAFSADGRWGISAGEDGAMRTWDLLDKTPVGMVPPGEKILAFATASDGWRAISEKLRLWDFSRAERFRKLEAQAASARERLVSKPDDPDAIRVMNEWFAFRGRPQWQIRATAANQN